MPTYVADIETDGFDSTVIHCMGYGTTLNDIKAITDYDEIRSLVCDPSVTLVMHNGIRFDAVQLTKVLGDKVRARIIDTLPLSWYLFPDRNLHGLEAWGDDFGTKKPTIRDWANLPVEEYIRRVIEDVKINLQLWTKIKRKLSLLYEQDVDAEKLPIVSYLNFKMECAAEQERSKWKLDKELCQTTLDELLKAKADKEAKLSLAMPSVPINITRTKPNKPYKKDGTLSVAGCKWFTLLSDRGLTKDHSHPICETIGHEPPNVSSHVQIKDWLYSLGWVPCTFDYKREDNGTFRKVPQVKVPKAPELTTSVLELADKEPAILELENLSIISHRITVFQGLLENVDEQGYVKAEIAGLTNTLRFKHKKPCVNLPGVDKPYGQQIRDSFIARDGYELCGADMVSLEATSKRHFMYPHDPTYADYMGSVGFDEHLDLAVHAGAITHEQMEAHKAGTENHSSVRKAYKAVNYSGIYGIGPPKLARDIGKTEKQAAQLLDDYWSRNWAIKVVAEEQRVKTVNGQKWLFNPISKFWYSLRAEKDRFSTLNQGTGAYCFDQWIAQVMKRRKQLTAQFHDEGVWEIRKGHREEMSKLLQDSIDAVNAKLKLNVELKISVQYGERYGGIH